jgi:CheY-like chemotaxis protein
VTAPADAASGSILVVEDNPEVAQVTAALLEELGYVVQLAGNADAALDQMGSRAFDLVVSDIVMAGAMNGIDLAREIRRRQPELPVVLMTGYSHFALGPEDDFTVLRKPVDLAELSRVTSRAIAEARQPPNGNVVRLHPRSHDA